MNQRILFYLDMKINFSAEYAESVRTSYKLFLELENGFSPFYKPSSFGIKKSLIGETLR